MSFLELKNIKAGYRKNNNILHGIDLCVAKGQTIAILGKNGSGKSTLAKAVMGLVPYCSGGICLYDETQNHPLDISSLSTEKKVVLGINYFAQGGQVFPNLTVIENLLFAAHKQTTAQKKVSLKKLQALFIFLTPEKLRKKATFLSGGEKHQLALAMVLINEPKLLILDEPSAGLSPKNVGVMYEVLYKLKQASEVAILLIEQNVEKAIQFSDKIAFFGNGKIVSHSPPCTIGLL